MRNTLDEKDKVFALHVNEVAKKSFALKRKVGAIIVLHDNIVSMGFNRQINNLSCENSNNITYNSVIHAEEDSIFKALNGGVVINGGTLYCTYSPCINCCRLIVQARIKRVVFIEKHPTNFDTPDETGIIPLKYLEQNGIEVKCIENLNILDESDTIENLNYLIYHSGDVDGLMSMYLMKTYINTFTDYIPYNYGTDDDWMRNVEKYKNCTLTFVDITPNIEWFKKNHQYFIDNNVKFIIYDHHKDRKEILDAIDKNIITYYFSNDFSATKLIYLFIIDSIPVKHLKYYDKIINYVSLYDTWKFKDHAEEDDILYFDAYMKMFLNKPFIFCNQISLCIGKYSSNFKRILKNGEALSELIKTQNSIMIERSELIKVGCINIALFQGSQKNYWLEQQINNYYYDKDQVIDIAISYNIDNNKKIITFSFRSMTEIYNVSMITRGIAENGGGHKFASGMCLSMEKGFEFITDCRRIISNNLRNCARI